MRANLLCLRVLVDEQDKNFTVYYLCHWTERVDALGVCIIVVVVHNTSPVEKSPGCYNSMFPKSTVCPM